MSHSYICILDEETHKISGEMPNTPLSFFVQISLGWTLKSFLDCNQKNSSSNTQTSYPQT